MSRWSGWTSTFRRRMAVLAPVALLAALLAETPGGAAPVGTVIAHRGDRAAAPENTLAAIRAALFKGADAVEIDVRWTSTGVPVIMHDETLGRTTDCAGPVVETTLEELSRCDAGSWFGEQFRGERVPTLGAALSEIALWSRSAQAVVHLKAFTESWQPRRILETVAQADMGPRTVFIADDPEILRQMREAGAVKLGLIFVWPESWETTFPYMIPQDVALDAALVQAAQQRGVTVWAIEGRPAGLRGLGKLAPIDGVLVNDLDAVRPDGPRAEPAGGGLEAAAPGWAAASDEKLSADLVAAPPAPRGRGAPMTADVPLPSDTLLSIGGPGSQAAPETPRAAADGAPPVAPVYVEPALLPPRPPYGPHPVPREGGWRPTGRLHGSAAALGT